MPNERVCSVRVEMQSPADERVSGRWTAQVVPFSRPYPPTPIAFNR
jgi:hypothetical protein